MSHTCRTQCVRGLRFLWGASLYRSALASLLVAAALAAWPGAVPAHEGHDHDKPPPLNVPVAPRVVAVTPDYELVGVLSGAHRLTIFLHRFETGEPVKDARLSASAGEQEVEAVPKEDGVFEASAPWIRTGEPIDIVFKLTLPNDHDILTGRLDATAASSPPGTTAAPHQLQQVLYVGAGALMVGVLLTLLLGASRTRRREGADQPSHAHAENAESNPKLKPLRRAAMTFLVAMLLPALWTVDRVKAQAALPSVPATMATDVPQRMSDGSLFVPKATQHLLSVRTILTQESQAPRTTQLMGSVVANPNSFGRVQSARPGRIEAPEAGLGFVGKRVEKGDLLGHLLPYIEAADKANIESQIAEADARIVKLRTILSRYNERPGSVPQVKVDEIEGEVNALLRKRAELQPSLVAREAIHAPIGGIISSAGVVVGQIVEARDVLFEIVDPAGFWVEAIAYDTSVVANLDKAMAVMDSGDRVAVEFAGHGLSLKHQASPLTFRITQPSPNLSIGKPVTVILQSTAKLNGIVLPASSVVRGPTGLSIVWVKVEPERFEPHTVRHEPLDGQRVVVLAGLKADMRVVTQGATLLNQIR